jgi:hypothetical protein
MIMSKLFNEKVKFYLVVLSFLISSGSVILIPLINFDDKNIGLLKYLVGTLFWLFIITGIVSYFLLLKSNNKLHRSEKNVVKEPKLKFLRPFRNRLSTIIDILFIISLAAMFYLMKIRFGNQIINCISVFAVLFTFEIHFLFNGENFRYLRFFDGGKKHEIST